MNPLYSKIKLALLAGVFLLGGGTVHGQNFSLKKFLAKKDIEKNKYHMVGFHSGVSGWVDHGTSPLIYRGATGTIELGRYKTKAKHKTYFGGTMTGFVGNPATDLSSQMAYGMRGSLVLERQYTALKTPKWTVDVGPRLESNWFMRWNPGLMNNAFGAENFSSLMLSSQASYNLDRKKLVTWAFWKFKKSWNPVRREITFGANVGLLNSYYRNGFAYMGQSDLINEFLLYDGYERTQGGQQLGTFIKYTNWKKNGNGFQWSYNFKGINTTSEVHFFGYTQHTIGFTYLIKSK